MTTSHLVRPQDGGLSMPNDHDEFKEFVKEGSEFWADKVKRLKQQGEVDEVIEICRRKLPLPAAFRELAMALRKRIKALRKEGKSIEQSLKELYEIAAYERFLYGSPTVTLSEHAGHTEAGRTYPAFNVAEIAHKNKARSRLSFPYERLGYEHFELLNNSDIKLLVELWGEPNSHNHPQQIYLDQWQTYVAEYEARIIAQNEASATEWRELTKQTKKKKWWPF